MLRRVPSSWIVALAMVGCVTNAGAAGPRDGAVIVDSGSTNTSGYRIQVWSDGSASIVLQKRGVTQGASRPFTVTPSVTTQFFANLKAVRAANVNTLPCMKSASFGTTTRVSWHGWTSPDLDCPSDRAVLNALVASVSKIRAASGIGTLPGLGHGAGGGPLHAQTPLPSASP